MPDSSRVPCSLKACALAIFFVLVATGVASGQQTSPAHQVPKAPAHPSPSLPGVFYDKGLDLRFNYPVEMEVLDFASDLEEGHQQIYGKPGSSDPEHQEAQRCMRPLLDVELPTSKAPQRPASLADVWHDASDRATEPEPITAKILLTEISRACLPPNLQGKPDDALRALALAAVSQDGFKPLAQPIWYEIGKQRIHMHSTAGRPLVNGRGAMVIMAFSTEWHGRLLEWVFSSNDTEIFNELTKSTVRFGDGPWGAMYPPNIGAGGPGVNVKTLPK